VYICVGPYCISACYTDSKENQKGFPEVLEEKGPDRWNDSGDAVSRYTGRELEKLVFIAQRETVEQPTDPLAVPIFQHFYGTMDDTLLQAIYDKSPMVRDRVST
jgi:hypothetical protein